MSHVFVFQEWDMMRERAPTHDEKLEKTTNMPIRTNAFSIQLQEARIKRRMTVMDLAERCGVTSRQMSVYENGTETPPPEVYTRIVDVLGLE